MSRRSRRGWGVFLLVGLLLLPGCGLFRLVGSESGVIGFEDGSAGEAPAQWEIDSRVIYTLTVDSEVANSGRQSLRLRHAGLDDPEIPKVDDDQTMATHCVDGKRFAGSSFLRLTAWLKVEGGTAFMWLRGPTDPETGSYSPPHVQTGGLHPQDWTQYQLVATKRQDFRRDLCIHLVLTGVGTLWADDLSVERFDLSAHSSDKIRPVELPNLDMEIADQDGRLAHWSVRDLGRLVDLRADPEVKRSGESGARLDRQEEAGGAPSGAEYCTDPAPFEGKALGVSGWFRLTDERPLESNMYLFLYADAEGFLQPFTQVFQESFRPSPEWTQHHLIASVPTGITDLCFGFSSFSPGVVFADDFSVEILDL